MNKTDQLAAYDNAIAFFDKEWQAAVKRGDRSTADCAETMREIAQHRRDTLASEEQP